MKKIVSLLLIALLALALIGCGGGKAPQSAPTAAPAKTEAPAQAAEPAKAEEAPKAETPTAAEPAPAEAPAAAEPENVSPFVGSWKLYAQEGGLDQTHEQLLAQAEKMGLGDDLARFVTVTFRDDGTYSMSVYGGLADEVWEDNGDGTGAMRMEGKTMTLSVKDGMLISAGDDNVSSFEKTDRTAG